MYLKSRQNGLNNEKLQRKHWKLLGNTTLAFKLRIRSLIIEAPNVQTQKIKNSKKPKVYGERVRGK